MIIQVGTGDPMLDMLGLMSPSALDFDPRTAYRDVFSAGDCDANVRELARLLGFGAHLPDVTTSACGTFLMATSSYGKIQRLRRRSYCISF